MTAIFSGDLGGMDPGEANERLRGFVAAVATGSASEGAEMIGHIKANFRTGGQMLSVSTTSLEGKTTLKSEFDSAVDGFTGVMNALVYGIPAEAVAMAISDAARDSGVFDDLSLKAETGCDDPACKDPDCAEHGKKPLLPL